MSKMTWDALTKNEQAFILRLHILGEISEDDAEESYPNEDWGGYRWDDIFTDWMKYKKSDSLSIELSAWGKKQIENLNPEETVSLEQYKQALERIKKLEEIFQGCSDLLKDRYR